nr:hypothetical protein Iba_chr13fCG9070 [Ipomoea batatas]
MPIAAVVWKSKSQELVWKICTTKTCYDRTYERRPRLFQRVIGRLVIRMDSSPSFSGDEMILPSIRLASYSTWSQLILRSRSYQFADDLNPRQSTKIIPSAIQSDLQQDQTSSVHTVRRFIRCRFALSRSCREVHSRRPTTSAHFSSITTLLTGREGSLGLKNWASKEL